MQILFNDQPMQCAAGQTVHELLEQLDQRQAGAALAINQQIVPREQWAQHIVQDGDQILLFRLLQGVEMLRIADKTFDFTSVYRHREIRLITTDGGVYSRFRQPTGDAGDETCRLAPAQRRYPRTAYRGGCDPATEYIRGENSGRSHFRRPSGT